MTKRIRYTHAVRQDAPIPKKGFYKVSKYSAMCGKTVVADLIGAFLPKADFIWQDQIDRVSCKDCNGVIAVMLLAGTLEILKVEWESIRTGRWPG